ncbi:hypothetical protein AXK12_04875 [Cephaloticoccus capnophilus]|uniref:Uncharacterized protein n=1 Tax=Cephaloticoccus capnophilus TaxID=1548208 RepID=A0A139SM86_9BACT|nr:hypothetical protein AXK12_04875 [Cephaloticoccus capnophilus]
MKRVYGVVFLLAAAFVLPSPSTGTALRDLGEGLGYIRVLGEPERFALPSALSSEDQVQPALVLDLRYVGGGAAEAQQLSEWLSERAETSSVAPPIFFLVNGETALALGEAAAQFAQNYPALLIGAALADGGDFVPDIVLEIDAEEERAAYALLASSDPDIGGLIGEAAAAARKRRYDEAAVIAAHAAPESAHRPSRAASTEPPPEATVARPVDLALQRAIHLHRAWRALSSTRKLP